LLSNWELAVDLRASHLFEYFLGILMRILITELFNVGIQQFQQITTFHEVIVDCWNPRKECISLKLNPWILLFKLIN